MAYINDFLSFYIYMQVQGRFFVVTQFPRGIAPAKEMVVVRERLSAVLGNATPTLNVRETQQDKGV